MKTLPTLLILVIAATLANGQSREYTFEEVKKNLSSTRDVNELVDCILDSSKTDCRHLFMEIRVFLPELLQTGCRMCSSRQREVLRDATRYLQRYYHDELDRLARGL